MIIIPTTFYHYTDEVQIKVVQRTAATCSTGLHDDYTDKVIIVTDEVHIKVVQRTAATCGTDLHDHYTDNVFISVCCHGAVWKQATVSQSVNNLSVCYYSTIMGECVANAQLTSKDFRLG